MARSGAVIPAKCSVSQGPACGERPVLRKASGDNRGATPSLARQDDFRARLVYMMGKAFHADAQRQLHLTKTDTKEGMR